MRVIQFLVLIIATAVFAEDAKQLQPAVPASPSICSNQPQCVEVSRLHLLTAYQKAVIAQQAYQQAQALLSQAQQNAQVTAAAFRQQQQTTAKEEKQPDGTTYNIDVDKAVVVAQAPKPDPKPDAKPEAKK